MAEQATSQGEAPAQDTPRPKPVNVKVNHHPVALPDRSTTGMGIKLEAIRQGVLIQPNFVLSVRRGNHFVLVGDDEQIKVHRDEDFIAVAPDDNS